MSRGQVCVAMIVRPSGRKTHSGFDVSCLLIIGVLGRRKCPVVPESKIPWSVGNQSLFIALLHNLLCKWILPLFCCYHHLCWWVCGFGHSYCFSGGGGMVECFILLSVSTFLCPTAPRSQVCWILDTMSRVFRWDYFLCPMKTVTREDVSIGPGYRWIMIGFVHMPWIVMSFMIWIISTTEAVVLIVESFEWSKGTIELNSKAVGSTISSIGVDTSSVTTSTSSSTLCHSKTLASMGGVLSMKSWWWHPLGGGVMLYWVSCLIGICCGGKGGTRGVSWAWWWKVGWIVRYCTNGWGGHLYLVLLVHGYCCSSFGASLTGVPAWWYSS